MRKVCVFLSLFCVAMPALAYIDPGSGSAIMSAIVGFFVAIFIVIKSYWYKLKRLFIGKAEKQNSAETAGQTPVEDDGSTEETKESSTGANQYSRRRSP